MHETAILPSTAAHTARPPVGESHSLTPAGVTSLTEQPDREASLFKAPRDRLRDFTLHRINIGTPHAPQS